MPISLRRLFAHQALHGPALLLAGSLLVGLVTRIVLLVLSWPQLEHSPHALALVFLRGAVADGLAGLVLAAGAAAVTVLTHSSRPHSPARRAKRRLGLALGGGALVLLGVCEVVFWQEFVSRFNFIAVDYLIYTREVLGNIRESYPVAPMFAAVAVAGGLLAWAGQRLWPMVPQPSWPASRRLIGVALAAGAVLFAGRAALSFNEATATRPLGLDAPSQELARNGAVAFVEALRGNALSFERFYATVDPARAERLAGPWPRVGPAKLTHAAFERPLPATAGGLPPARPPGLAPNGARPRNIVLIQVESLSAEFLGVFGNRAGITPNLDGLARDGVLFTDLYATGTRTVRGLEALSAALPPLPGQSLVRRAGHEDIHTLGAVLADHGFDRHFLYGGYGYFDNMNAYFSANGYAVRDRNDLPPQRQSFATIWGVADELLFDDALERIDQAVASGRRQFFHVMTTSNHRPFTYPEGRIDIPSKSGRDGAVKYTDWAIGHFMEQARNRPWFRDTLFVVVADHCASSAGKTRIPPDRYLIPAIFYAPDFLAPARVNHLASQIDLAPTLVRWMGFDDGGRFFGQDLFGEHVEQRAWLGNYQEVGRLSVMPDGTRELVVLAPRRQVSQYRIEPDGSARAVPVDAQQADRTIADYQLASEIFASGRYRHPPSSPGPDRRL